MNKKSILWILLDFIFLVVFNTVFFVLGGFEHPASVWLSYGFIHLAYIMVFITNFLVKKSSSAVVFGYSLYSISSTYFLVEFVVGLVFVFLKLDTIKMALSVQIIIAGIYAVFLLSHMIANESTAESVARQEAEVAYIKVATTRVKALIGKLEDKKINKEIERVYDLLHSSPTKTHSSVRSLETQIKNLISDLESAVAAESLDEIKSTTKELINTIEERNMKIRLNQ